MKCEVCRKLLEEYLDRELAGREAEQVGAHLIRCVSCARAGDGLAAEQEVYARYDRSLEVAPALWGAIAARATADESGTDAARRVGWRDRVAVLGVSPSLSFAGAVLLLLTTTAVGVAYLRMQRPIVKPDVALRANQEALPARATVKGPLPDADRLTTLGAHPAKVSALSIKSAKSKANSPVDGRPTQSDVLFSDVAYSAIAEQETQRHIEQAQNLLRSVRNIEFGEDETEIDVSYEKALSRQLLNDNVVLRREAEMSGSFPVKTLLSSLEPFLLDIANLPDRTSPEDLRVIRERVRETEIVAALHTY